MSTLAITYQDSLLATFNESHVEFEKEARRALAVKLYELGRITSGQAAEMAGVSRLDLLLDCPEYGTPSVKWDAEELASEFGQASK